MDAKKEVNFLIDSDLYEKFKMTITLNKTNQQVVLEDLVRQYVADSFASAAKQLSKKIEEPVLQDRSDDDPNMDYGKAVRKIPGWAQKPHQNNHRIIKAFFELETEQGLVSVEALTARCSDPINYPATYLADFRGNFNSMKTDTGNSHGKVFEVEEDIVQIWDEVELMLLSYKETFLGTDETRQFNRLFTDLLRSAAILKAQTRFSVKILFPDEWDSVPFPTRRKIGKLFFSYVQKGLVSNIVALPEKDEDGSQLYLKQ